MGSSETSLRMEGPLWNTDHDFIRQLLCAGALLLWRLSCNNDASRKHYSHVSSGAQRTETEAIQAQLCGLKSLYSFSPLPFALLHRGTWLPALAFYDQLGSGEHMFTSMGLATAPWSRGQGELGLPEAFTCTLPHSVPPLTLFTPEVTSLTWTQRWAQERDMQATRETR